MKSKRKILSIIVLVLIIIGAIILRVYLVNEKGNENSQEKENTEESMKDTLSKEFDYISSLTCSALDNATGINANYIFVDNEIYEYNRTKLYSNNENCKFYQSLDSTIMTYDTNQIQTKEGYYIRYTQEGGFRKRNDSYSYYQKYFKTLGDNVMYTNTFTNNGNAIISIDNQIRLYKIDNQAISYQDIEYNFDEDEYVIYVSDVIKTNKAFYKVKRYKTNKEECDKYVDVACIYEYKLEKIENLTKYYNDIKIAMNNFLIDKENNIYFY